MKLQFKEQDFQLEAINAVCSLFEGQKKTYSPFTVANTVNTPLNFVDHSTINHIDLDKDVILRNMHSVQEKNHLPHTNDHAGMQFSIEMETGTGKTYVYTRTILELNKRFGFCKFIIVVPSVAIREGVYKSLQTTKDHFAAIYNNPSVHFFIYDSSNLPAIRTFATATNIEIMIINIDAFKKAENVINQQLERFFGDAAIDYIKKTNPIVIIDEPQSVDHTEKSKEAIVSLNPLCVLRYSATHREKINLLYRLTPVDAFEKRLVKQIFVASNKSEINFNKPYVKLISVSNENGFTARINIDIRNKAGQSKRKTVTAKPGSDLFELSGKRELYKNYVVSNICCEPGFEEIEFANTECVKLGQAINDVDDLAIKRVQIRRTIETHFDKELRYYDKGIKVLSLFFIDEVKKYRPDDGGKGIYAQIFEEEYYRLINLPKYAELFKIFPKPPETVHAGYFSKDKKGSFKNTRGNTADDVSTYNMIMRDKEKLLSFRESDLRFIFSHSALKEGWDNPNVFQVCTLIEQKNTLTARQKIGRGLRLCVNQNGDRIEDPNINILHVMANESFAEFAENLQKEIEDDVGIKFGFLENGFFSGLTFEHQEKRAINLNAAQLHEVENALLSEGFNVDDVDQQIGQAELPMPLSPALEEVKSSAIEYIKQNGSIDREKLSTFTSYETVTVEQTLTYEDDQEIRKHLQDKGYITNNGKISSKLHSAVKDGSFSVPKKFEPVKNQISSLLAKLNTRPPIRDASKDVHVKLKKEVFVSEEFKELWNRIKQKTTYRINIDDEKLMTRCVDEIRKMPAIPKAKIVTEYGRVDINQSGVKSHEFSIKTDDVEDAYSSLPNLITELSSLTTTKRATIYHILDVANRFEDFLNNPQIFIDITAEIINRIRMEMAIDGITYKCLNGHEYYVQEIFDCDDILANLDKNAVPVEHGVYDHIIYDSYTIEKPFAEELDNDPDVKMFFKIPRAFKVDTPIGCYNPDWAVYVDKGDFKKLYLVIETKGGTDVLSNLRSSERLKIECGKKHFKAINADVALHLAKSWHDFKVHNL